MNRDMEIKLQPFLMHTGYYNVAKIRQAEGMDANAARWLAIFGGSPDVDDPKETDQSEILKAALEFNAQKEKADKEKEEQENTADAIFNLTLQDTTWNGHSAIEDEIRKQYEGTGYDDNLLSDEAKKKVRQLSHQRNLQSFKYRSSHMLENQRRRLVNMLLAYKVEMEKSGKYPHWNHVLDALQAMNLTSEDYAAPNDEVVLSVKKAVDYAAGNIVLSDSEPEEVIATGL